MSGFFPLFLVGAYLAILLVEVLRGAERMHRHPSGNRGFLADVALKNAWLFAFVAAAATVVAFVPSMQGLMGWLAPNAAGLGSAVLFSMFPPVRAARHRLRSLGEVAA